MLLLTPMIALDDPNHLRGLEVHGGVGGGVQDVRPHRQREVAVEVAAQQPQQAPAARAVILQSTILTFNSSVADPYSFETDPFPDPAF